MNKASTIFVDCESCFVSLLSGLVRVCDSPFSWLYCGLSELWNNQSGNNQNWKNQNMSWSESSYLVLWWKVQTSQTQLIVWSLALSWSRSWSWSLTSIFNIQCQELKRKCSDQLLFSGQFHQGFFPTFVLFCCFEKLQVGGEWFFLRFFLDFESWV